MRTESSPARRIGILLYREVEVLDAAGPYEVFTCASRMALRARPDAPPPFTVHTLAASAGPVRARAGLQMVADQALAASAPPDVWLVPGGVVAPGLADRPLLAQIARLADGAEVIASVCNGAFLLAAAGVLPPGTPVTTHWEDADDLAHAYPELRVERRRRYLDTGRIVTSAGISAGIDMALHLVARLAGLALAERTARQMDVVWTRDDTHAGG